MAYYWGNQVFINYVVHATSFVIIASANLFPMELINRGKTQIYGEAANCLDESSDRILTGNERVQA
jgi:hypothetical protein